MSLFRVDVVVTVDPKVQALIARFLDMFDDRAAMKQATAELGDHTAALKAALVPPQQP